MKVVVFDDDIWMAKNTCGILQEVIEDNSCVKKWEIIQFTSPEIFLEWLKNNKVDVAVLDISVSGNDNFGIECAKEIRNSNKDAHIIFLTSNESKIFEVFSGLIRPTQFIVKSGGEFEIAEVFNEIVKQNNDNEETVVVSYGRSEYIIDSSEIISLHKIGRKTTIILVDREIEVSDSLATISKKLNERFLWVDKGTIVNAKMIKEINYPEKKLVMTDDNIIYMSRNAAKEVKKCFADTR